jgi:hypothetical protein
LSILLCISTVFIFGCEPNNPSTDSPYNNITSSFENTTAYLESSSAITSDSSSEKIPFANGEIYKFFSLDDFYLYAENNVRDTINFSQKPLTVSNAEREILHELVDVLIKAEVFSPGTNKDLLEINEIVVGNNGRDYVYYIYLSDSLGYKIYIDQTNTDYSDWDLKYFSLTKKEYNDMCYYVKYEGTQNEVISSFEFKIKEKLYVKFGLPKEADKRQALKNSSLPILSDLICDDISAIYDIIYPVISSLRNSYK